MNKRIYFKNFKKVNFIYPKNCLPLWIKNFLYKKNQGVLSEILTGTSFNLTNTVLRKFNIFEIQGNTEQTQLSGKNLLINTAPSATTKNGITFTKNQDGTITANGTSTNVVTLDVGKPIVGNYKYSGCPNNGGFTNSYRIRVVNSQPPYTEYGTDIGTGVTINFNEVLESDTIRLHIDQGVTVNNLVFKPMISTNGGEYEPYCGGTASPNPEFPQPIYNVTGDINIKIQNEDGTKEQNLPFTLGTQRLMLGDDLKDDGIHHNRKQYTFTGQENWATNPNQNTENTSYFYMVKADMKAGSSIKCNHFVNRATWNTDQNAIQSVVDNSIRVRIDNNVANSLESFKTWLSNNNVIVEYELETEETEAYTETQAEQYNAIKELYTYEGTTNIEGTSSEISPILKIQYYEKEQ